jgi:Reverse transcriptase (RNA-dependent DNA polymerase)
LKSTSFTPNSFPQSFLSIPDLSSPSEIRTFRCYEGTAHKLRPSPFGNHLWSPESVILLPESNNYKYNPDGSVITGKEKAHLVAQCFSQQPKDYRKTYAPVVKLTSVCIVLAFVNRFDYKIMSFDVKTAFLHAQLTYSIHVKQIPGYLEENPRTVLKLLVALYGLKQSAYE